MKRNYLFICSVLLAALALAGCKPKSADSAATEETFALGPQYSKKGLLVPDDTRQSLGVKTVEVTEQKVPATLDIQLRIYQVGGSVSLASAAVTPDEAKRLKTGQVVQVRSSGGGNVAGKVTGVNDQLQKATGMAEVLVELRNPSSLFAVGGFQQASVALDSAETVVTIPRAALLQCSDGYSVYTVSGEHLVRVPVKVGAISGDLVEIKDGLYAGDQVVLQPVMSLWMTELAAVKAGQACCVQPAKGK